MSQDVFAEKLGLTKNYISLVENGNRNLSEQSIKVLCSILNVNEEWLRTETEKCLNLVQENKRLVLLLMKLWN
ncbi:MAG: helix-turn-helix domain-containing protein [Lachnospira pectinoschiza]